MIITKIFVEIYSFFSNKVAIKLKIFVETYKLYLGNFFSKKVIILELLREYSSKMIVEPNK
jgi:hypothetical protein